MAERIPTQSHIYTVLKRQNCPIYTHTVPLSRGPGTHPSLFEAFLRSWWVWAGGVVLMKDLWCAVWSPGLWESWVLLHCPIDQQRDVLSFHTDPAKPPQTGSAGGGGPVLSTPSWLMVPRNNPMSCEHCKRFLFPSLHLAPALPHFSSRRPRLYE